VGSPGDAERVMQAAHNNHIEILLKYSSQKCSEEAEETAEENRQKERQL
jgi:hypothetical protein